MPPDSQPPIFVVSLPRARERREALEASLASLGLSCTTIDAVDAVEGVPPELEASIERTARPPLSEPEFGCALSHARIYRRMVEEGLPYAIILEDDALPTERLRSFVENEEYRRSSLILLYHGAAYIRRLGRTRLSDGTQLAPLAANCSGTVGYSLDLEAARALMEATTPVRHKADWPLDLRALGACITRPVLVGHPPTRADSVIAEGRSKADRSSRRKLTAAYYRLKWRRLWAERVRSAPHPLREGRQ
jgi:glycosyl transferase family 25